jgi:hypothetical protein
MAERNKPLVDKEFLLERFPGKGGWTYAAIPEIPKEKDSPFGWFKVKGSIDSYEISDYNLMPMGNGCLFLPVKAEIRKKIGKEEGDYVHVKLYKDDAPYKIPEAFELILREEHGAYERFTSYKKWEQRMCINWIYSAKREETVRERIIKTLCRLQRRERIV